MGTSKPAIMLKPLLAVGITTAFVMTTFELLKEVLHPPMTIWTSHTITIVFTTVVSFVVTAVLLNWHGRMEQDLRESERRLRALFEQAAVGIAEADPGAMRYLNVNKRYCEILGRSQDEVLNSNWPTFTHPDDVEANLHNQELLLAGAIDKFSMEKRYIRKDGEIVWASLTVSPIRLGNDKPIYTISVIEDITARKNAERDLMESERRFRALFEQAAVGVAEIDPVTGRFLAVNKRYCDIVGLSRDEMLHTDFHSITHPDDLEADLSNLRTLLRGEQTEYSLEKRYVRKDGEVVWVSLTAYPIWLVGEKPTHHIAIVVDITEKKQAESALRNSEEKFSKAFHATPSAIAISRAADGLLLEVNEAFSRMMEYSREEVVGRTTAEVGLWADPQAHARARAQMLEHGRVRDLEGMFRTKSGKLLDGLVFGESLVLGKERYLLTVVHDITELKKADAEVRNYRLHLEELVDERTEELKAANEKLMELDRLKSMFVASMSHELRTPLNAIIGFTGITLQGLSGALNDQQQENLSRVYRAAKHLLSLINDVIDISQVEAGRVESYPEKVALDGIVDEAIGAVTPQAQEKGVGLVAEVPHLLLTTDRRRLLQCLLNLLSNAVKYTEAGTVTVAARETDGEVAISVIDTGVGIAEADQPKVFMPFERFDSGLRVKVGGTGLGLYLTRKIARDILHGDVVFRSKEGEGSTFTIILPRELHTIGEPSENTDC